MLEENFERLYLQFRLNYYKRMAEESTRLGDRLTATEYSCVEIIYLLGRPTLTEFASFLNISLPNATYKVNSLAEKGYVKKVASPSDKRESALVVTEKYLNGYGLKNKDTAVLMRRIRARLTPAELEHLDRLLAQIAQFAGEPRDEGEETT